MPFSFTLFKPPPEAGRNRRRPSHKCFSTRPPLSILSPRTWRRRVTAPWSKNVGKFDNLPTFLYHTAHEQRQRKSHRYHPQAGRDLPHPRGPSSGNPPENPVRPPRRRCADIEWIAGSAPLLIDNPEWPLITKASPFIPGNTSGTFLHPAPLRGGVK